MADEITITPEAEILPVEQEVTPAVETIPIPYEIVKEIPAVPSLSGPGVGEILSVGNNQFSGWNVLFTFECTCGNKHTTQAEQVWADFNSVSEVVTVRCQETGELLKVELKRDHPLKSYDPAKDVNKQTGPAMMRHLG